MRRIKTVLGLVAVMAAMLVVFAAPAMADDNDRFDFDDDIRFIFDDDDFDDDDFFDNDFNFDNDFDQEAESGDVDQSFVVTNTGDNSNQCVSTQGVANTGNAQNQLGFTTFGDDGDFDDDDFFDNDNDFDNDFEFDDVDSTIEVSPTNTTSCDQQVNQAATASG
jgi:hypothetical protein